MSRRRLPPEAQHLLEQARRNAEGTPPRKHHLVPASYLERWSEDGKIRVTVIDEARSYLSSPSNAARETDYYRVEHPDVDPNLVPPLLFEMTLSHFEGAAKAVIDDLLLHGDPARVDPKALAALAELAWHLAFSLTRGKTFRDRSQERVAELFRMYYENITDDGIRAMLHEHGVDPTPEQVTTHRDFIDMLIAGMIAPEMHEAQVIAHGMAVAEPLGAQLLERHWLVYETPPILITCDELVVLIGGPGWPHSEQSGVAVAGVVLFPLAPHTLLAMFHPGMRPRPPLYLDHIETAEINREIIAAATRWAFERPSRRVTERLRGTSGTTTWNGTRRTAAASSRRQGRAL